MLVVLYISNGILPFMSKARASHIDNAIPGYSGAMHYPTRLHDPGVDALG